MPPEWREPPADGEEPASPYGILALRTDPSDAQVIVDGEAWAPIAGQADFVIHLMSGWHQIEVRREGYEPFSARVELIDPMRAPVCFSRASAHSRSARRPVPRRAVR